VEDLKKANHSKGWDAKLLAYVQKIEYGRRAARRTQYLEKDSGYYSNVRFFTYLLKGP